MNPEPSLLPNPSISLQPHRNSICPSSTNTQTQALNAETTQTSRKQFLLHVPSGLHPRLLNPNIPGNLHTVSSQSFTGFVHLHSYQGPSVSPRSTYIPFLGFLLSSLLWADCFRIPPQIKWHGVAVWQRRKKRYEFLYNFSSKKWSYISGENEEQKKESLVLTLAQQDEFPLHLFWSGAEFTYVALILHPCSCSSMNVAQKPPLKIQIWETISSLIPSMFYIKQVLWMHGKTFLYWALFPHSWKRNVL